MFGSYVMAAISLSSMPIVYSLFVANRWQLPFPINIIGIDEASHPGYEIHYAYCVITIMYGGLAIAGKLTADIMHLHQQQFMHR